MAHLRLQRSLKVATEYFKTWKLRPHPEKSQHVLFTNRRIIEAKQLSLNNAIIPQSNTAKYLGIILDKKLTWDPHLTLTAKKGKQIFAMNYPLLKRGSKLSISNKLLTYRQIIRPALTYGSLVWGTAATSHINKLQVLQNKCLRTIVNAPFQVNMSLLQEELGILPIKEYIKQSNIKKLKKAQIHDNPLIPQILSYVPVVRSIRNRPKFFLIPPPIT